MDKTKQPTTTSAPGAKQVNISSESQTKDQGGGMVKSMDSNKPAPAKKFLLALGVVVVILVGVGTGYFLSLSKSSGLAPGKKLQREVSSEEITKGTMVGVADEKTFRDSAEGDLKKGGIEGEGSHHLVRPGGESQYVYLTSSVIDLDQFADRKVKIWGETFAGQRAGWLMDVGRLEVLE